ncbi:VapC toxin family PIN domain ribonuclease, partial [Candidatus Micrarchaeota archaeon]|nr:VapC toxin family PIN domain ribonuclease [Candidatus Micrarchaeota archaeon]
MKVIDSSFLVAFYSPTDQFHAAALSEAKKITNESLLLPDLIL